MDVYHIRYHSNVTNHLKQVACNFQPDRSIIKCAQLIQIISPKCSWVETAYWSSSEIQLIKNNISVLKISEKINNKQGE